MGLDWAFMPPTTKDEWCGDFQQEPAAFLGAGFITVRLEEAAFRTASVEHKFIVAISLNSVPGSIFKMVEPEIAGQSLFARLLRIHAPKGPVLSTNTDAFVDCDGLFFNVQLEIGVRTFPLAASTLLQKEPKSLPIVPL